MELFPIRIVIQCCKDLAARDRNHGSWVDGQIPDSFTQARECFGVAKMMAGVAVVESAAKMRAVLLIDKLTDNLDVLAGVLAKMPDEATLDAIDDDSKTGRRMCHTHTTIKEVRELRKILSMLVGEPSKLKG